MEPYSSRYPDISGDGQLEDKYPVPSALGTVRPSAAARGQVIWDIFELPQALVSDAVDELAAGPYCLSPEPLSQRKGVEGRQPQAATAPLITEISTMWKKMLGYTVVRPAPLRVYPIKALNV